MRIYRSIRHITCSIFLCGLLIGCSSDSGSTSTTTTTSTSTTTDTTNTGTTNTGTTSEASGLPSHGPFVVGTEVVAIELEDNGDESSNKLTTTIGSDYKFSFDNDNKITWTGPTIFKIIDGEYYNEATGGYSVGSLSAIENVVADASPSVNINILTDIAAKDFKADGLYSN